MALVLSIDLDCVMQPSISSYDDGILGCSVDADEQWASHPDPLSLEHCPLRWKKVKEIYHRSNAARTVFRNHHHEILPFLPDGQLEIHNLDHHHDIAYPGWNDHLPLHEGNWIQHLARQGRISSYHWYRNPNSEELNPGTVLDFPFHQHDLAAAETIPRDYALLFVCLSPNWVPPQLWDLRSKLARAHGRPSSSS
jgi:hypothetical protein